MAEVVQYHLEQMVGELEDLERRKLFTQPELRAIVKRRTKYEYGLRRRRVSRAAFLHYIEYEINVDALRRKRKHRLLSASDKTAKATTLSDFSIGRRIVSIFERALARHPTDLALWLQYIEYTSAADRSEEGEASSRALSKIYAAAITKLPYEPRLWIMAATHELGNSNGAAARLLLHRALRLNPTTQHLWLEYFRLELLLAEKIKARRRVLGIDAGGSEELPAADDNVIELPALAEEQADGVDQRLEDLAMARYARAGGGELSEEQRAALSTPQNAFLQGAVAALVFDQAIRAVPDDLSFREEFAAIFAQFPGMDAGRQRVLDSIAADFAGDAQARAYLCTEHLEAVDPASPALVDALRAAVANFSAALGDLDTPGMWEQYVAFLARWHAMDVGESLRAYFAALLARAAKRVAEDAGRRLSEPLALALADVVDSEAWLADATRRFPASEPLWCRRLEPLLRRAQEWEEGEALAVVRVVEAEALPAAPHARRLWDLWLAWVEARCAARRVSAAGVQAKYLAAFARTAHLPSELTELKAHLQIRFVDWAWALPLEGGASGPNVAAFRSAYQVAARNAFPTAGFYRRCLELEPDAGHATTLHEFACRLCEADQAPWLAYLRFLIAQRRFDSAAAVFWRASKALPSDEARAAFDSAYQALLRGNVSEN
ncbi:U3 snoRNP protein [Coemansia thaxteri]|nr:U3 snoRNP protein [Coemansia thaxteri]KAJ2465790.1 U3 snoRNP protein [Coemansia sp. RSA 2322]